MDINKIMDEIEMGCAMILSPQVMSSENHEASAEVFMRLIECLAFLLAVKANGDSNVLDVSTSVAESKLCETAVEQFNLLKKIKNANGA